MNPEGQRVGCREEVEEMDLEGRDLSLPNGLPFFHPGWVSQHLGESKSSPAPG